MEACLTVLTLLHSADLSAPLFNAIAFAHFRGIVEAALSVGCGCVCRMWFFKAPFFTLRVRYFPLPPTYILSVRLSGSTPPSPPRFCALLCRSFFFVRSSSRWATLRKKTCRNSFPSFKFFLEHLVLVLNCASLPPKGVSHRDTLSLGFA